MMRIKIGILMLLGGILFFSSCNKNKTYAEMKRDQKKAINKFITENDIEILNRFPSDGIFKDNQFVLLDNGVYLNVVDSGNGNRATLYKTNILMRCSGKFIFKELEGQEFDIFSNGSDYAPIDFIYGYASTKMEEYASWYTYGYYHPVCYYLSTGVESALEYVGENGIVKLIVPFEMGSTYQTYSNYGAPIYFDRVRFQFY